MHLLLNVFGAETAQTMLNAPSVTGSDISPIGWVEYLLFVLGLTCDAYLFYHFIFLRSSQAMDHGWLKVGPKSWGARELIVGTAAIVIAFALTNLLYLLVAAITHRDVGDLVSLIVISEVFMRIGILVVFAAFLRERGQSIVESFGLRVLSPVDSLQWGVLFGFGSLPLVQLLVLASEKLFKAVGVNSSEQPIAELFATTDSRFLLVLLVFFAVVIAPIFEEALFRGFAYPVLKQRFGVWRSLVIVSAVFAASHMHLPSVVPLFVFALGLGLSYELTGSLLVPITMHALFNAVMVTQLIFERNQP
jgi:membrane protease YdiL (CAAX protease family)